jgi:23S rRNA pseudouridine1911/1915/1917 synthase
MINEPKPYTFCAEEDEIGERLDKAIVARLIDLSRTQIQQFIKDGKVLVNESASKPAYKLETGDCVSVMIPVEEDVEIQAEDIELEVLYEDDHLAVINKPAGMVTHPAQGNEVGTLVNAALARWPQVINVGDDPTRAGVVHRLDKDTSGVILIALTNEARLHLMAQFKDRIVEKHYIALVERHPTNDKGRIDAPIARDPRHRKRMSVQRDGKEAITEFFIRERFKSQALLDVFPKTGRTHQIRVHLAFIKCPIIGDRVYGYRKQGIKMKRLFLHAFSISFDHPITGERLTFEAPMSAGLQNILDKLPTD